MSRVIVPLKENSQALGLLVEKILGKSLKKSTTLYLSLAYPDGSLRRQNDKAILCSQVITDSPLSKSVILPRNEGESTMEWLSFV